MDLNELTAIAGQQMSTHGLHDWTFALSNSKRQLGVCKYRTKRIEIAEYYARNSPPETVLDTLLHEIAHALAGPAAHHGPIWKAVAVRLGATPRACDKTNQAAVKPGDWQATCPACNKTFHRYKRPQTLSGYRCRCKARSPLQFQFKGDPVPKLTALLRVRDSAKWEATCPGCAAVHLRIRKPKEGAWRCGCSLRCELSWRVRAEGVRQA